MAQMPRNRRRAGGAGELAYEQRHQPNQGTLISDYRWARGWCTVSLISIFSVPYQHHIAGEVGARNIECDSQFAAAWALLCGLCCNAIVPESTVAPTRLTV